MIRIPHATLAAILAALLSATPAAAQFGPQGPPAVGVTPAERRAVTETNEFVGRIEAIGRVELRARVTGFLQEQLFQEGQEVRRGEVLFRIERPPFEAEVARAQAQVAAAEAELTNARIALNRARELVRSAAGTQVRVDDALAAERNANAQLLGAQAQLRVAQINLGYTEITAPIDGKIGRVTYTVGNTVSPTAQPLATIVSQDPMRVSFPVSLRTGGELRQRYATRGGTEAVRVRIVLPNGQPYPEVGRIDFIDPQVDRNTDTILVRASIPNPLIGDGSTDRRLIDGMFVTAVVEGAEPVQVTVVPRAAVAQDQGGSFVFVVDAQGNAQRRNIRLGRGSAELAVVEDGLQPGENVITEGLQRVRPGQPVNAAPAGAAPARAAGAPGATR
ncbi:efflux RND transporter periplasmic adaptor subunit [Falsiroseomonas sp. CW058]|uniref:efflux RND transporter periplasmic adaptor subunit n=1 Tax=Falsiroseomonas sp. CW058 TaxID=3388664 RepID=UPI003D3126BE